MVLWKHTPQDAPRPMACLETSSTRPRRARPYVATYQFDFHGKHVTSATYPMEDSIRQDVLILFDPQNPSRAMVMPEVLNPGS